MSPPVIVVEGSDDSFERALADVRVAGWSMRPGFETRMGAPGRAVRFGPVSGADDAAAALLAALAGTGIVVKACASREVLDRLLGDLRHLGPVDHRHGSLPAPIPELEDDSRAILTLLAAGRTLGEAAHSVGLSRRTADRRLAAARRALGADRTVEAVARARRLGLLG